jgi:hypothetical protein
MEIIVIYYVVIGPKIALNVIEQERVQFVKINHFMEMIVINPAQTVLANAILMVYV